MNTKERIDRVAAYIAEQLSTGWRSVSKLDEIDDSGTLLGAEVDAVLHLASIEGLTGEGIDGLMDAFDTMSSTWSDGYETASVEDFVNDNGDTVEEVVMAFVSPEHEAADLPSA